MPFLDKVVEHINAALRDDVLAGSRFAASVFHGIAVSIPDAGNDGRSVFVPAIVGDDGEMITIQPDDRYSIQIYHRVNSSTTQPPSQSNYGDGVKNINESYSCSMIIHAWRDAIKMDVHTLEAYLAAGMPSELSKLAKQKLKMQQCTIRITDKVYDSTRIWQEEYRGSEEVGLRANSLYFRINYQVQQSWGRACISICETC